METSPEEYRDQIESWIETVCDITFTDSALSELKKAEHLILFAAGLYGAPGPGATRSVSPSVTVSPGWRFATSAATWSCRRSAGVTKMPLPQAFEATMIAATSTPPAKATRLNFLFSCSALGKRCVAPT
jgi:hypothetical protein